MSSGAFLPPARWASVEIGSPSQPRNAKGLTLLARSYARTVSTAACRRPENLLLHPPWGRQSGGWGEFHSQRWGDVGAGRRIGLREVGDLPVPGAARTRAGGENCGGEGALRRGGSAAQKSNGNAPGTGEADCHGAARSHDLPQSCPDDRGAGGRGGAVAPGGTRGRA